MMSKFCRLATMLRGLTSNIFVSFLYPYIPTYGDPYSVTVINVGNYNTSFEEYQVTSVTSVQIVINPRVWYSYYILLMKNNKSKSMGDSGDRSECYDRYVFL